MRFRFLQITLQPSGVFAAAAAVLTAAAPVAHAAPPKPSKPLVLKVADLVPIALPAPAPIAADPAHPSQVASLGLEPAPMPNPDIDVPGHAAPSTLASLTPAFISRKLPSASDGFARASSASEANDARDNPAAGLNLSVPVKQ